MYFLKINIQGLNTAKRNCKSISKWISQGGGDQRVLWIFSALACDHYWIEIFLSRDELAACFIRSAVDFVGCPFNLGKSVKQNRQVNGMASIQPKPPLRLADFKEWGPTELFFFRNHVGVLHLGVVSPDTNSKMLVKIDGWEMICWLPFFGGQKAGCCCWFQGVVGMQGTSWEWSPSLATVNTRIIFYFRFRSLGFSLKTK